MPGSAGREAALRAAVLAARADDRPRWAYADWLEGEAGDPAWAAFIRAGLVPDREVPDYRGCPKAAWDALFAAPAPAHPGRGRPGWEPRTPLPAGWRPADRRDYWRGFLRGVERAAGEDMRRRGPLVELLAAAPVEWLFPDGYTHGYAAPGDALAVDCGLADSGAVYWRWTNRWTPGRPGFVPVPWFDRLTRGQAHPSPMVPFSRVYDDPRTAHLDLGYAVAAWASGAVTRARPA